MKISYTVSYSLEKNRIVCRVRNKAHLQQDINHPKTHTLPAFNDSKDTRTVSLAYASGTLTCEQDITLETSVVIQQPRLYLLSPHHQLASKPERTNLCTLEAFSSFQCCKNKLNLKVSRSCVSHAGLSNSRKLHLTMRNVTGKPRPQECLPPEVVFAEYCMADCNCHETCSFQKPQPSH
jgi:hypothetical protein